jgi:5-methylcytosine-specific restriction endonuclease McrA
MKRAPLTRRTPLRPSTPLQRRTRLRPGRTDPAWRKIRRDVLSRAQGRCEAGIQGVCTIRAEQTHHLRLRSQGGADDGGNLLAVCGACHGHIHRNVAWAVEHGFIWQRRAA